MSSLEPTMKTKEHSNALSPDRDLFWQIAGLCVAVCVFFLLDGVATDSLNNIVKAQLVTSGAMFGFSLTALSLLFSSFNNKALSHLVAAGKIGNLADNIFFLATTLFASLVAGFIYLGSADTLAVQFSMALLTFSAIFLLRIGFKFHVIFWILS